MTNRVILWENNNDNKKKTWDIVHRLAPPGTDPVRWVRESSRLDSSDGLAVVVVRSAPGPKTLRVSER